MSDLEKKLGVAFLVPLGDPLDQDCRWGLNTMLWGEPGIGKSDRIEAAAASVGLPPHTLYAATTQPEDVSGAAFPNASMGVAMFAAMMSELHTMLDEPLDPEEDSKGFYSLPRKLVASVRSSASRMVSKALTVARKYGPGRSSIEPLLPGIREIMADKQGVIFLDELSCARPAVQAAYLGVVLGRKVGGVKLPPGARIIAAANPPDSAAGGWELEPPMANRFCHFSVPTPSVDEWGAWLMNESGTAVETIDRGEDRVRESWHHFWPATRAAVFSFLRTQPSLLHQMPMAGHASRGLAWPSPRTWAFATRALNTCKCLGIDQATTIGFIEGCVGEGAATALASWLVKADLPHPLEVLENGWAIDKLRLDRCMAVYTGLVSYVITRKEEQERLRLAALAWKRFGEALDENMVDVVTKYSQELVVAGYDLNRSEALSKSALPVMTRLSKMKAGRYIEKR